MKVIRKQDVVSLEMSEEEAATLLEMINSNVRRQANEFDRTRVMGCWGCQEIALNVSNALSNANIIPHCPGSRGR